MARVNITIIGLQRLGTSFGLALKHLRETPNFKHEFIITGNDDDRDAMQQAHKLGATDREVRNLQQAVEDAELIFIASPYGITKDVFSVIGEALKPGAVVMDASPIKQASMAWAKEHFRRNDQGQPEAYLVGVTVLVNPNYLDDPATDTDAAHVDLFNGGLLVVSPAPDCPQEAVQLIADLAGLMGLTLHFADPVEHDGMIASMEGLPVLLQLALFRSLSTSRAWDDLRKLGNTTFSLTTYRLGNGLPEDLTELIVRNKDNTVRALESLIGTLDEIRDLVVQGDAEAVKAAFGDSMERYRRWQAMRRKNDWGERPEAPNVQARSIFSGLLPFGGKKSEDKGSDKK